MKVDTMLGMAATDTTMVVTSRVAVMKVDAMLDIAARDTTMVLTSMAAVMKVDTAYSCEGHDHGGHKP